MSVQVHVPEGRDHASNPVPTLPQLTPTLVALPGLQTQGCYSPTIPVRPPSQTPHPAPPPPDLVRQ